MGVAGAVVMCCAFAMVATRFVSPEPAFWMSGEAMLAQTKRLKNRTKVIGVCTLAGWRRQTRTISVE